MTVVIGIKGHCAHCDITFNLKPWQLNAIAIEEPFDCPYCQQITLDLQRVTPALPIEQLARIACARLSQQ
ncbi:hypothetical protein [Pseudomonas sp. CHM02]|uniref:hypothetical protein n=1 Tax=Pseudomonas sp. CHM02 TaxID=1463662 RepID=UPI0009DFC006|nr:hypothetical protein [Pseudomonas sp. CHM02]